MKNSNPLFISDKISFSRFIQIDYNEFLIQAYLWFMENKINHKPLLFQCTHAQVEKLVKRNFRITIEEFEKKFQRTWDYYKGQKKQNHLNRAKI
jgi:hypothetical protein